MLSEKKQTLSTDSEMESGLLQKMEPHPQMSLSPSFSPNKKESLMFNTGVSALNKEGSSAIISM